MYGRSDMQGFNDAGAPLLLNTATDQSVFNSITRHRMSGLKVPYVSDFTSINSVTAENKVGRLVVSVPQSSTTLKALMLPNIPSAPWTIDFCASVNAKPITTDTVVAGIATSDGTKYVTIYGGMAAQTSRVAQGRWTNANTSAGSDFNQGVPLDSSAIWMRMTDDGTTRSAWYSCNGKDYIIFASAVSAFHLTPSQCGMGFFNNSSSVDAKIAVLHFEVTPYILGDQP